MDATDRSSGSSGQSRPAGPPLDAASQECRALLSAAFVGTLVAWAPALPAVMRDEVLVLALVGWTACLTAYVGSNLRQLWRRRARVPPNVLLVAGVAGLAVALLLACQLELIRRVEGRPAFTWIHDWRWALNHAQAIARSGGVGSALDYSGVAIDYHVGPAWLAAAVQRLTGAGLSDVLFGLVPPLCILTMALAGIAALRAFGVPRQVGLASFAVALALPLSDRSVLNLPPLSGVLLTPLSWPYLASDQMLNSLFGFAVGLGAVALMVGSGSRYIRGCAAAALGSVVELKPQYYAGLATLVACIGVCCCVSRRHRIARPAELVVLAALTLPLAILTLKVLPGDLAYLGTPRWAPRASWGPFVELVRVSSVLALGALGVAVAAAWAGGRRIHPLARRCLLPSAASVSLLAAGLYFVDFPYRPVVVERLARLGFSVTGPSAYGDDALAQALEPPRLLLLAACVALVALTLRRAGPPWRGGFLAVVGLAVVAPVPLAVAGWVDPPADYGVAEEAGLRDVLAAIPVRGTLLVSSDLADPAQGAKRALRSPLLTAYGGHAFYVADLRYVHYLRADALLRAEELRRFFGTTWSPWHDGWLTRAGVTHVLIDERCRPVWADSPQVPLRHVVGAGRWTALARSPGSGVTGSGDTLAPVPDLEPAYGQSGCLSGRGERW